MEHKGEKVSGERRNFFSKIKENYSNTFSKLSISSGLVDSYASRDHDGDTEDNTLIHNAMVTYYDSLHKPYPEWLGAKPRLHNNDNSMRSSSLSHDPRFNSQYKKNDAAKESFVSRDNSQNPIPQRSQSFDVSNQQQYIRRSSSRLDALHNTRKNSFQGYSYNSQVYSGDPSKISTSASVGSRLRDRILNNNSSNSHNNNIHNNNINNNNNSMMTNQQMNYTNSSHSTKPSWSGRY